MRRFITIITIFFITFTLITIEAANAYREKTYHFGFKRSVDGKGASIANEGFQDLLEKYGAIFNGDTNKKELYLTFDNGYENGYTAQVLDLLKEKKVPAIFFVTGHYVKSAADLVRRMVDEGHLIGNHSWSHPDMTTIPPAKIKEEINRLDKEVYALTGQKMHYFRPPRGIFDEQLLAISKELNYTNVFWSIAYKDWDIKQQNGAEYAYQKIISQLHPGAVILLHTVSKDNAAILGKVIDEARRLGYEFKSLDEMRRLSY